MSAIANLATCHPFSLKHASNVCTNASKMMNSIIDNEIYQRTSDPLTQFSVVFSALVHDADHVGVPNMTLMKEKPRIAALYRNKSCAEQNSVDLAWNLLMVCSINLSLFLPVEGANSQKDTRTCRTLNLRNFKKPSLLTRKSSNGSGTLLSIL